MRDVCQHILSKIKNAGIKPEPFPHVVISEVFPPGFYPSLLAAIPPADRFVAACYPGTGFGKGKRPWSGLVYPSLKRLALWGELRAFLKSDLFCGIPAEKYKYFAEGAREFSSVFDLQIDRRGYEILPHPDVPSKLITFQFYLTSDDSLRDFGTLLCRTKGGQPAQRNGSAIKLGNQVQRVAELLQRRPGVFWQWLERTKLGTEIGLGDSRSWYPWRMFEIVSSIPALPNHFMAFAPNERSYHAVRMNIPASSAGRTVLRGFVCSGRHARNFVKSKQPVEAMKGRAIAGEKIAAHGS